IARKGSRAIIKDEESGVLQFPVPAPICSVRDFAIPKFAAFGFCVRSFSCAKAESCCRNTIARVTIDKKITVILSLTGFMKARSFRGIRAASWISQCNLCVLCVSVVVETRDTTTTESQTTQRLHRAAELLVIRDCC